MGSFIIKLHRTPLEKKTNKNTGSITFVSDVERRRSPELNSGMRLSFYAQTVPKRLLISRRLESGRGASGVRQGHRFKGHLGHILHG